LVQLSACAEQKGKDMRSLRLLMGTLVAASLLAILAGSPGAAFDPPGLARAIAVQERHTDALLVVPGVVGTAVGMTADGEAEIKIFTESLGIQGLPRSLSGVPVVVVVTGRFVALNPPPHDHSKGGDEEPTGPVDPTSRFARPVPIGVSTGHLDITAGTISARVMDGTNVYALSNNHVYADTNDAALGDNVLQPGVFDGGKDPADAIGTLYDFEPLVFNASECTGGALDPDCNTIDAAIALSSTANLGNATPEDGYGTPKSATKAAVDLQRVIKYGRTTRQTEGTVIGIHATVDVGYSMGTARFVDQIVVISSDGPFISTEPFIQPGDSGSLLVTKRGGNKPVGLLFAGTADGIYAIANEIDLVLNRFAVTIDGK